MISIKANKGKLRIKVKGDPMMIAAELAKANMNMLDGLHTASPDKDHAGAAAVAMMELFEDWLRKNYSEEEFAAWMRCKGCKPAVPTPPEGSETPDA